MASSTLSGTAPNHPVVPTQEVHRWIEPWYVAYAILGALASGTAVILIPVAVTANGGSAMQIGAAIAALNFGVLFAPFWGWISDRSRAYRSVFFSGFLLIALGFLGFAFMKGTGVWFASSFLIGFGTGASNTVASLFIVEFTPAAEWSQRISWLQTFNAIGCVLGVAGAGLLRPQLGMLASAFLVVPALIVGGIGLPVPGGPFHMPTLEVERTQLARLMRRVEPLTSSIISHLHRLHLRDLKALRAAFMTGFSVFLASWFLFSLGVSAFFSLYPVLMLKSFGMAVAKSSLLMSAATALSIPLYNIAGRLATRRGPAPVLNIGIAVRMIALAGLGLLGFFRLPFSPVLAVVVFYGAFQGIWPLLSVASNDMSAALAPFSEGTAMGLFNAAAAVASASGAIIGGAIAERFGYPSSSLLGAAIIAIALVLALRLGMGSRSKTVAPDQPPQRDAG